MSVKMRIRRGMGASRGGAIGLSHGAANTEASVIDFTGQGETIKVQ